MSATCTRRWRLASTAGGRPRGAAVGWLDEESWHHPDGDLHAGGGSEEPREWWQKKKVPLKEQLGEELVHRACLAILHIKSCAAPLALSSQIMVQLVIGWLEPSVLCSVEAECAEAYLAALRQHSSAALSAAIVRLLGGYAQQACGLDRFDRSASWITPSHAAQWTDWRMCRELFLAKLLLDRRVPDAKLRQLADKRRVCSRADWAEAFDVPLPKRRKWRAFGAAGEQEIVRHARARAIADGGSLASLSVHEVLVLAAPPLMPPPGEVCAATRALASLCILLPLRAAQRFDSYCWCVLTSPHCRAGVRRYPGSRRPSARPMRY